MEVVLSTKTLPRTCRGCLDSSESLELYTLTESELLELFTSCTSVEVSLDDNLPKSLCIKCYGKCESWAAFKMACLDNDAVLRQFVDSEEQKASSGIILRDEGYKCDDYEAEEVQEYYEIDEIIEVEGDMQRFIELEQNNCSDMEPFSATTEYVEAAGKEGEEISQHEDTADGAEPKDRIPIAVPKNPDQICTIECLFCRKHFDTTEKFEEHWPSHQRETIFQCQQCDVKFRHRAKFKDHMYRHSDFVFPCPECGFRCNSRGQWYNHKHRTNERNCICDICGKGFNSNSHLRAHQKIHEESKPFPCETCGIMLKSQRGLKNHMLRHEGVRSFACDLCDRSYLFNAELQRHIKIIHNDERNHICLVCEKRFRSETRLKLHMRVHTGERPYECDFCGQKFARPEPLKCHKLIHTGEKPHECKICNQFFRKRSTLVTHMRVHNKVK